MGDLDPYAQSAITTMTVRVLQSAINATKYVTSHDLYEWENANNSNNQKGTGSGQKPTCFECGVQGHYRKECPRLKNNKGNRGIKLGMKGPTKGVCGWKCGGKSRQRRCWVARRYHVENCLQELVMAITISSYAIGLTNATCCVMDVYDRNEKCIEVIFGVVEEEELYAKFSKCEFWIPKVQFLGTVDSLKVFQRIAKTEEPKAHPERCHQSLHDLEEVEDFSAYFADA
ncbi:putative reverse transcriptase domain-containing protein [Tanacetum coccineum]|uniref:Reverse transcriptase domain-containing protein n=1 Tax=Tanacetum coccineum TaxID=301880 RepID=A0ABQ5DY96_9ASTR